MRADSFWWGKGGNLFGRNGWWDYKLFLELRCLEPARHPLPAATAVMLTTHKSFWPLPRLQTARRPFAKEPETEVRYPLYPA